MGWLSNWLQELIMIVLLATFVDMLLPNRSMERYVKLVLSLLILLTLLSPITKLLKSDPVAELKRAMTAMESPSEGNATLEQILAQGKRLQLNEQEQSLTWTAKELAKVMKGQIEQSTGERVQSVEVRLLMDTVQPESEASAPVHLPVIQSVMVEMSSQAEGTRIPDERNEAEAGSTSVFEVDDAQATDEPSSRQEPIQVGAIHIPTVQIKVRTDEQPSGSSLSEQPDGHEGSADSEAEPVTGSQETLTRPQGGDTSSRSKHAVQIISLLTENWDIDASQVQVTEQKNAQAL
ncbi:MULTISPECIES: stage III sporulation protein AF [Paenibacillus]|uniref:stage III sporulation protein AF n=1 Tax=Paenibacillus TaxID=44249 RepID=UPI0011A4C418|nr:stage III sporulation protein AF [Paenibacillus xylanexedens]